jgi:hypothetical protein
MYHVWVIHQDSISSDSAQTTEPAPPENSQGADHLFAAPHYPLSDSARSEIRLALQDHNESPSDFLKLREYTIELAAALHEVDLGERYAVLDLGQPLVQRLSVSELKTAMRLIASSLGELLDQDSDGTQQISVYDRNPAGSIAGGARYHQTHEGGSIHTDNVNQPDHWDYLVLGCVASGASGGESIIVNGLELHRVLELQYPEDLRVLQHEFLWDNRGFDNGVYSAPIITYTESGEPLFRYLRPYMEAAHRKANQPLTKEQIHAIDTLDTLLASSELQRRFTLQSGMMLITNDSQILHGRTLFADFPDAVIACDENQGQVFKRTMERFWVAATKEL